MVQVAAPKKEPYKINHLISGCPCKEYITIFLICLNDESSDTSLCLDGSTKLYTKGIAKQAKIACAAAGQTSQPYVAKKPPKKAPPASEKEAID